MIAIQNSIVVKVDANQKNKYLLRETLIKSGKQYSENYRERTPVVAEIIDGVGELKTGRFIVTAYTCFDEDSQYLLFDNTYSIPVDEQIFALIEEDGSLTPVNGNLIVERQQIKTKFILPEELRKNHIDRGTVLKGCDGFNTGDFIFWLRFSDYGILYTWNNIERSAIKIYKDEIVGILKN